MSDTLFSAGTVIASTWLNDVDKATYNTLSAVGGTNTITATGPQPVTPAGYTTGLRFFFNPANTNTGATTININSLGAKNITKFGATALIAGDLVAGAEAEIYYDGTQFQLINPPHTASNFTGTLAIANGGTGQTTANTAFTALSAGVTLSFRNKLINALGAINQRAYVSGTATGGANQYTLDRWRVVTSGQNLTFSTSGIITTMTAPAGGLEQVIEGNNIEGGVYTLSWTGTATATVNGSAVTNGGQTSSLTAGSNVTIRFTSGTVSLPQFEKATTTTSFEYRPYAYELLLAQRYYETFGYHSGGNGSTAAGELSTLAWRVPKRVAPTVSQFTSIQQVNIASATPNADSEIAGSLTVIVTANGGWIYRVIIQASAEL
jgi:hypothetical protein